MKFTLAFYGVGARARPYLDALARRPDISIAAVCDLDRRTAEQVAAGWQARVFLDGEAMLQEVRPDALWVCVEPQQQGQILMQALDRQIPLFVEPPGATNYEQALRCAHLATECNLVTAVGFATCFTDVVQEARQYLGANRIPIALDWWLSAIPGEPACPAIELLWSHVCRHIDALRFFCGEVSQVHTLAPAEAPGGLVVHLQFATGGVGVLTCASFARPAPRIELELLGEGWSLAFEADFQTLRLVEGDRTTTLRCLNTAAADHAAAFLDALAARDPLRLPTRYAEALQTLAVCQAAAVSAREGRPVSLFDVNQLPRPVQYPPVSAGSSSPLNERVSGPEREATDDPQSGLKGHPPEGRVEHPADAHQ
jgi:predicted dehydrogenase